MNTFLITFLLVFGLAQGQSKRPHILFIVADDLGYNDIGYKNRDMITPNLDKLAASGVKLSQAYVQPVCSPSRSAWMSGFQPYHTGLQHAVINSQQRAGLPLNVTTLPEKLKRLGYMTHMVGKWHLGFCNWSLTPTYRGFDSFVGYYTGMEDYYNHTLTADSGSLGIDFRFNERVFNEKFGEYSTHVFAQRAVDVVNSHDRSKPLFVYLPFQSVHYPLEVPEKYENMYRHIPNKPRRIFSGMVSAMDEAVGNVTQALKARGMFEDTVIFFTTDNGGQPLNAGNNWPLRGGKTSLWEGGTRGLAFVSGPTVKSGEDYQGLFHAVDWHPTILRAAGSESDPSLDGIDQWENVRNNIGPYSRTEMVYNIDRLAQHGALRVGDYKLLVGPPSPHYKLNYWYPVPTGPDEAWFPAYFTEEYVSGLIERRTRRRTSEVRPYAASHEHRRHHHHHHRHHRRQQLRLFNLRDDPNEHVDLATIRPDIVGQMYTRYLAYKATEVAPDYPDSTDEADPAHFGGAWSPGWC